jgi:hypothetical protein
MRNHLKSSLGKAFKNLLTLFTAALSIQSYAQITFNKTYGGINTETAYKVDICKDGGYVTGGYTRSQGQGFASVHIIKTDKYGEMQWESILGGNNVDIAYGIAALSDGGYVAVGSTNSFGAGQEDVYVVKVDDKGKKMWEKTFGGTGSDVGWDIRETSDGGLIVTGSSNSWGASFFDAFLLKLDASGNQQWRRLYGGGSFEAGFCVREAADGGFIMFGQTHSIGEGQGDFYLVKTTKNGTLEWEKTYGGELPEEGRYLALTSDGGYIMVGKTESKGSGDEDIYVVKVDEDGEMEWEKTYGGDKKDTGKSIEPTKDGGYIITSSSRSFGFVNPRVYIIKIKSNGSIEWTRDFGGWNHDHGHHILPTEDGGYIATGHYNQVESQKEDTYLLKLNSKGDWNPNAKDAGITNIISPLEKDCASEETFITVRIKNHGNAALKSYTVKAILSGGINKTLTKTFNTALAQGESNTFNFDESLNTIGGVEFKLKVTVETTEDVYEDNNNIEKNIKIKNHPKPVINLGEDMTKTDGVPIELDAGEGFVSYEWSTGETTRKITASNSEIYWVEVVDKNECIASDTVVIMFTGIEKFALSSGLKVFPNPSAGIVEVIFDQQPGKVYQLSVFDFSGQQIFSRQILATSDNTNPTIDLTGRPAGIYLLSISDGEISGVSKIIIK